jgi:hypothetical protein
LRQRSGILALRTTVGLGHIRPLWRQPFPISPRRHPHEPCRTHFDGLSKCRRGPPARTIPGISRSSGSVPGDPALDGLLIPCTARSACRADA